MALSSVGTAATPAPGLELIRMWGTIGETRAHVVLGIRPYGLISQLCNLGPVVHLPVFGKVELLTLTAEGLEMVKMDHV